MTSDVYFIKMETESGKNILSRMDVLCQKAGILKGIKKNNLVGIKLHMGEHGSTSYLPPVYIQKLVELIKPLGAKPFLTDTNTLYRGRRSNSVEHIMNAIDNGFAYSVVNAPIIIADGLKGKSATEIPINKKHFSSVKIANDILAADFIICATHITLHIMYGLGGALKNIGMGIGSSSGKQMMHSPVKPEVGEACTGCGTCLRWCPVSAISLKDKRAFIDHTLCIGCGECTTACPERAIPVNWGESTSVQERGVEFVYGYLKDRKKKVSFLSYILNVTPHCDCFSRSDPPIVSDVGILASRDPVAIDQAAADLVNAQQGLENSKLDKNYGKGEDKIKAIYPDADWTVQLRYAEELGLGTRKYRLVKV